MANPPQHSPLPAPPSPHATPLNTVLAFAFLNSLGTGAVQTGVFFLLQSAFGFGRQQNYVFGLVLYGAYVAGALAAGPALRRLARDLPGLSTRGVLVAVVAVQGLVSLLPRSAMLVTGAETPPEWSVWTVGVSFGVLTGVMWPIVESYLSGGRSGKRLNTATGRFNVLWSAAVLASFWLMAPLLKDDPIDVITALGLVQLASIALIAGFRREPARHLDHDHEPHPEGWRHLLAAFRVLLPLIYVVSGTLSPMLPALLDEVGVALSWGPPIASAWLVSRVAVFFIFERWAGWHGSRLMPAAAGALLIGGFIATVLSPRLGTAALPALVATLAVFGAGHAMIYLGALYYAMEVGKSEVDAGGKHEALIGLGYGIGPAIGLSVLLATGSDRSPMQSGQASDRFDTYLIAAILLVATIAAAAAWRSIRKYTK